MEIETADVEAGPETRETLMARRGRGGVEGVHDAVLGKWALRTAP